jgi:neutral ceramidase
VVKVLVTAEPGELNPVSAKSNILYIPRRKPSDSRLERALEIVQHDQSQVDATEWTFAKETVMLDALIQKEPTVEVEVQAIQVGPSIFLANPSEFFCQYGLNMKANSKFSFTFPVELANDSIGYIPTEEAMGEHGGGYETRLTAYSNLEVSAGTKIVDALLGLADKMTPGEVPEPPKTDPSNATWSYGNVPPEVE